MSTWFSRANKVSQESEVLSTKSTEKNELLPFHRYLLGTEVNLHSLDKTRERLLTGLKCFKLGGHLCIEFLQTPSSPIML